MSSTEWIGASQVTRSETGSSSAIVSGVNAGSSSHASGSRSITRRYSAGIGRVVDRRAGVVPLEVDGVDAAERGQLVDELVGPRRGGVELEAERRVELQPCADAVGRGRLVESRGDDERERARLVPDRLAE